jgi:PAS domain S-box-containing protein
MTDDLTIRLLCVEDNRHDADQVAAAFAEHAPDVVLTWVTTGRLCLELVREQQFDAMLLDNRLPDMDGTDVLRELVRADRMLPVVFVTGVGDEETVVQALRLGAVNYVPKRVGYVDSLPALLRAVVAEHRRMALAGRLPSTTKRRILYVEHLAQDVELTLRHFSDAAPQFVMDVARTSAEGMQRLATDETIDLVLLDLRMPDMSGVEFVREANQQLPRRRPFVVVTGMGDESTAIAALQLGVADYVVKRTGYLNQLVHTIEHVIERDRLSASNQQLRTEIRERTRAESALRESEERFAQAFRSSPVGICITALDGHFVDVNAAFCNLVGFSYAQLLGRRAVDLGIVGEQAPERPDASGVGDAVRGDDVQWRHRDGSVRDLQHVVTPIELHGRRHWLTTVLDVTDRNRAEAQVRTLNEELEQRIVKRTGQLQASNEELEAFAYSVSHDLRAPLRAVDGFVNILAQQYGDRLDAEGRRLCGVISESARTMGQLIDELLEYSRTGRVELHETPVDMAALARTVFAQLASAEDAARIEFTVGAVPVVHGDATLLRTVWANLLDNAIKFTRQVPRAVIEVGSIPGVAGTNDGAAAALEATHVTYFVRDNGAGFDMRYVGQLFGMFKRLHPASEFKGTGVGLAIVRRIIQRHGGRVWAEGVPGEGATIYFTAGRGS